MMPLAFGESRHVPTLVKWRTGRTAQEQEQNAAREALPGCPTACLSARTEAMQNFKKVPLNPKIPNKAILFLGQCFLKLVFEG